MDMLLMLLAVMTSIGALTGLWTLARWWVWHRRCPACGSVRLTYYGTDSCRCRHCRAVWHSNPPEGFFRL